MSPTGKNPKLGEQIVPPPETPIVTDPLVASSASTTPSGLAIPAEPPVDMSHEPVVPSDPPAPVEFLHPPPDTPKAAILLETGQWVPLTYIPEHREFRVRAKDGQYYEHVGDLPDGTWMYRQV